MALDAPRPTLPLLRSIFDRASDAILAVDRSGRVVLANPAAAALFGYPMSELLERVIEDLVPEDLQEAHVAHRSDFERHPANRAMGAGRHLFARRRDATLVPFDISLTKVDFAEGSFTIAVARDVTVYRRFLDACPIAIFVAEDERIAYTNPAGFGLLGADANVPLRALALGDIVHPDDREAFLARLRRTTEDADISPPLAERVARLDGAARFVEATAVRVPNTAVPTILLAVQDVTERRETTDRAHRLENALQQQQRLADIGAVTTRIAHDIANPIAGLIMGTQRTLQVLDRLPPDVATPVRPSVDRVLSTAKHLASLLEEFKDFSRQQRLDLSEIRLDRFVAEIEGAWSGEAAARNIELRWSCPPDTVISADLLKMRRVFDNLVKNAMEAIDRGPGEVAITVAAAVPGQVAVTVADTGPGIAAGTNPFALFETTKPNGTGLGLPSVKQIVEAHGGTIDLVAERPRGAAFRMVLPTRRPR